MQNVIQIPVIQSLNFKYEKLQCCKTQIQASKVIATSLCLETKEIQVKFCLETKEIQVK